METVNIVVKQNIANWVKEEPPALAMLNGGDITSTIFIHTDETGLNPPTDEFPGDLGFEIKVSNGTKSKEAHVSTGCPNELWNGIHITKDFFVLVLRSFGQIVHQSKPFCQL